MIDIYVSTVLVRAVVNLKYSEKWLIYTETDISDILYLQTPERLENIDLFAS